MQKRKEKIFLRSRLVNQKYELLKNKTVAIIGVGGTGNIVANLFARMEIGKLILIDRDIIDKTNLERQILYDTKNVGQAKVDVAKLKLKEYCEKIDVHFIDLNSENINDSKLRLKNSDLIIDCTDNLKTRFLLNDYCKKNKLTWLYTGAIKNIGSIFLVTPTGPCIECFMNEKSGETCGIEGVTNFCTTNVASIATSIAVDFLTLSKIEEKMIYINLNTLEMTKLSVKRRKNCNPCNKIYKHLDIDNDNDKNNEKIKKLCGTNTYIFYIKQKIKNTELRKRFDKIEKSKTIGKVIKFKDFTIFPDKRVIIKAKDERDALKTFNEYIGS
ncbi:MAG: ThiF family adenylyltransferase [Candidatus Woesearchaeota archaeon]|jgi:adenylyltransferase/sulfurtransferase